MSLPFVNGELLKELIDAINNQAEATKDHAQALRVLAASGNCMSELIETRVATTAVEVKTVDAPVVEKQPDHLPDVSKKVASVTLIELRERLATIADKSKVKDLIQKYGASKLTDISSEHYGAMYAESEALL